MKFTKACDYGMLLAIHLSSLPEGKTTSVKEVAEQYDIPERFLANIVNKLANASIVHSQRGIKGGIRLAKPGDQVRVREIIEALDGPIQLFDCQKRFFTCSQDQLCSIKGFWETFQNEITKLLDSRTLADFSTSPCGSLDKDEAYSPPQQIRAAKEAG